MIDVNTRRIIEMLIEKKQSKEEIKKKLSLTDRQFQYSLEKLNDYITYKKNKPIYVENSYVIIDEMTQGFLLDEILNQNFVKSYNFSAEERQKYILLSLLYSDNEILSIKYFLNSLEISKSTFISDLKKVEELVNREAELINSRKSGYRIEGSELNIRRLIINTISYDLAYSNDKIVYAFFFEKKKIDIKDIYFRLNSEFLIHNIDLVENKKIEFIYIYIFLLPRIQNERIIESYELKKYVIRGKEYSFVKSLLGDNLNSYHEEYLYLTAYLLGGSVGSIEDVDDSDKQITELVDLIIKRFEIFLGEKFNDYEKVFSTLYSHFKPSYYRMIFGIPILNPLTTKIKNNYTDIYKITEEVLTPVGYLINKSIPDEEIAFLTLHFVAMIDESITISKNNLVAAIICPHGIGSSAIAYNELKILFPEFLYIGPIEMQEILDKNHSYDVIFSTVHNMDLYKLNIPVFFISPIMTSSEKYELYRKVYTDLNIKQQHNFFKLNDILSIIKKSARILDETKLKNDISNYLFNNSLEFNTDNEDEWSLLELTNKNIIKIGVSARNWKEAVYLSASPMLENEYITRNYIEKIIDIVEIEGPYMLITKNVMLSHASSRDGVLKNGLGIAVLKEPVCIGTHSNNPVKFIFTLSILDQTSHFKAMSELVRLLSDSNFCEFLNTTSSSQEIMDYLSKTL